MTTTPNPLSVEGRRRAKAAAQAGVTAGVAAAKEEWHRDPDAPAQNREPAPETKPATDTDTDTDTEQESAAAQAAAAAAQERQLAAWADEYERLLPAIHSARPLPAQVQSDDTQLSGAEWIADGVRQVLKPRDPSRYRVEVFVHNGGVFANVTCPPDKRRRAVGEILAAKLAARGNLGTFEVKRHSAPRTVTLQRRGIEGAGTAWAGHGTRARNFFEGEAGRAAVFDLAGLFQSNRHDKKVRRYPIVHSFGEDHRGGTVELRLRGGMLLRDVQAKRDALAQAFNAPDLEVKGRGVFPVIHLNTGAVSRELPKVSLLRPEMLVRPLDEAGRYAAAKDFVLPIGVRVDDETGRAIPIMVNQDTSPHAAIMGKTGSGKTVLLSQIVKAAVAQGAETILWDAKQGKDLRALAKAGLPGVVHYDSGASHAALHRTIQFLRDELDKRKATAEALSYRGIEYRPAPLLAVLDELPAWIVDLKKMKGDAQKAAELTESRLNFIASQARELRIFFVVAGQYAYVEGYPGMIRTNTSTLVSLGVPEEINMANLFAKSRKRADELAATITKKDKGLGVVVDSDTNRPELFRGFFNPPGDVADRFEAAVRRAPKLRRWSYRLPRGSEEGSDGSWADWTPVSDPSSDDLAARYLDGPDGQPIPAAEVDDPTSTGYRPGVRPTPKNHLNDN